MKGRKHMKRYSTFLLVLAILLCFSLPGFANTGEIGEVGETGAGIGEGGSGITPMALVLGNCTITRSISGSSITINATTRTLTGATKSYARAELQRRAIGTSTWALWKEAPTNCNTSGGTVSSSGTWTMVSGYEYRGRGVHTAYSGSTKETTYTYTAAYSY